MTEEDKTPVNAVLIFKYLARRVRKIKPGTVWTTPMWLEPEFEFNLKTIMNNYGFREACEIVNSIKRHFFKGR